MNKGFEMNKELEAMIKTAVNSLSIYIVIIMEAIKRNNCFECMFSYYDTNEMTEQQMKKADRISKTNPFQCTDNTIYTSYKDLFFVYNFITNSLSVLIADRKKIEVIYNSNFK